MSNLKPQLFVPHSFGESIIDRSILTCGPYEKPRIRFFGPDVEKFDTPGSVWEFKLPSSVLMCRFMVVSIDKSEEPLHRMNVFIWCDDIFFQASWTSMHPANAALDSYLYYRIVPCDPIT